MTMDTPIAMILAVLFGGTVCSYVVKLVTVVVEMVNELGSVKCV